MHHVSEQCAFGHGEESTSINNTAFMSSKQLCNYYDVLIFVDSRGLERDCNIDETWLYKLCKFYDLKKISYLAISRPKNITVFPTLINFLKCNNITFKKLITNLGFVDCTPKKDIFVRDIELQIKGFYPNVISLKEFGGYGTSNDENITLFSLEYPKEYVRALANELLCRFQDVVMLTTSNVDINIKFKRDRPSCFYEQLKDTNYLVEELASLVGSTLLNVNSLKLKTFDAVHFTREDHQKLFNQMITSINNE
tara:strand:- start:329 stop:1087 length:759 start_codon:yes stop_codon:yes gene_type:complete